MIGEYEFHFLGEYIGGRIGGSAANFQLQLDTAFFRNIMDDRIPVGRCPVDIPLIDRREPVNRRFGVSGVSQSGRKGKREQYKNDFAEAGVTIILG